MDFYIILKEIMDEKDMTISDVSKVSGLTDSTVRSIIDRKQKKVALNVAFKLSKGLNVSLERLNGMEEPNKKSPTISGEAERVARAFDALDEHGQSVVRVVLEEERQRMAADVPEEEPAIRTVPLFGAFAAGPAEPDYGNTPEPYEIPAGVKADFAIRVSGTSMEPYLHDGSIALGVFRTPREHEVGAFILNGEYLVKQLALDHLGNLYLLSLNRAEADKDVVLWASSADYNSLRALGTIITDRKIPKPRI